jgi:hypothetical protein
LFYPFQQQTLHKSRWDAILALVKRTDTLRLKRDEILEQVRLFSDVSTSDLFALQPPRTGYPGIMLRLFYSIYAGCVGQLIKEKSFRRKSQEDNCLPWPPPAFSYFSWSTSCLKNCCSAGGPWIYESGGGGDVTFLTEEHELTHLARSALIAAAREGNQTDTQTKSKMSSDP